MFARPDSVRFHTVDIESSGALFNRRPSFKLSDFLTSSAGNYPSSPFHVYHQASAILQIYGTNLRAYQAAEFGARSGFVRPAAGYVDPFSGKFVHYQYSPFVQEQGILGRSQRFGRFSEEASVRRFYRSAELSLAREGSFTFAGWNPVYDLSLLESATHRYASLSRYRGFFAKHYGKGLDVLALEDPFLQTALRFGQANPEFASKYFRVGLNAPVTSTLRPGGVARNLEQMKMVPGWSLENIVRSLGGRQALLPAGFGHHEAVSDVLLSEAVYQKFRIADKLLTEGQDFNQAFQMAGILKGSDTAADFFKSVYTTPSFRQLEAQARAGSKFWPGKLPRTISRGRILLGLAITASALLAFSRRPQRQTQITGLADTGMAASGRHEQTDFGSGYRGTDEYSPTLRTASILAAAGGGYAGHKYILQSRPGYATKLYENLQTIERRSPMQMLRTFGLSDRASSYLPNELFFSPEQLYRSGSATDLGSHFERLLGIDVTQFQQGMRFSRVKANSPYLELQGHPGYEVRFAQAGRLTSSSARYHAPLEPAQAAEMVFGDTWLDRLRNRFRAVQKSQWQASYSEGAAFFHQGENLAFQPLYGRRIESRGMDMLRTADRFLFELGERPQRLLSEVGLGLRRGSYNKLLHVPLLGQGGFINNLLWKRALPIYLGYTALKYLDYQLDHGPSELLASLPLRANLLRAEATDRIPGFRAVTDYYNEVVPGPQYGPLALPLAGGFMGAAYHYSRVLGGDLLEPLARKLNFRKTAGRGALVGGLLMLPFLPGMLGSRKTAAELRRVYSGEDPVEVRAGRWWDLGSTPFEGNRIKYFRPHWFARMRAGAEEASLYGSEEEYWGHHPLLHPFRYLRDPNWLERRNYWERPYPVSGPALSNVPLVGPVLSETVGRVIKPPVRMHSERESSDYTLYNQRVEPRAGAGLPPVVPAERMGVGGALFSEGSQFADFTGLPGFIAKTAYERLFGDSPERQVTLQSSNEMTSLARRYYELELGALFGMSPGGEGFGYTEPFRRFVQPDRDGPDVNEVSNRMPSWMPGAEYMVNFRVGDPYVKVPEGYLRLPGAGYAAMHPELQGVAPEDYPLPARYAILADVAPYSVRYAQARAGMQKLASRDAGLRIQFEKTEEQVRRLKESTVRFDQRHFTEETDEIHGTVGEVSPDGFTLEQYPGRTFTFSAIGSSGADLSAEILRQENNLTREQVVSEVELRQRRLAKFVEGLTGQDVRLVVRKGSAEHAAKIAAVVFSGDENVNRQLIAAGLAAPRPDLGGPESGAMYGTFGRMLGSFAESVSFVGDESALNPFRYLPTPFHTKYWQQRTALSQYEMQEVYGTRQRRWGRPVHDFLGPYSRGLARRVTGERLISEEVQSRRDLDSLVDVMDYLRSMNQAAAHPEKAGRYTSQAKRTNIGADLFGSHRFLGTTLPRRDRYYFPAFLAETDPEKRQQILSVVSPELARTLTAQWVSQDVTIQKAEGKDVPRVQDSGRLVTEEAWEDYTEAETQLSFGDYQRSREIAEFFARTGFTLPDSSSPIWNDELDYEDVKLKIVQQEGYDKHDFNLFDDRASQLWRKPWLDGAVRELTSGSKQSAERIRLLVERMILESRDKNPRVLVTSQPASAGRANIQMTFEESDGDRALLRDLRRNPEAYRSQEAR